MHILNFQGGLSKDEAVDFLWGGAGGGGLSIFCKQFSTVDQVSHKIKKCKL